MITFKYFFTQLHPFATCYFFAFCMKFMLETVFYTLSFLFNFWGTADRLTVHHMNRGYK